MDDLFRAKRVCCVLRVACCVLCVVCCVLCVVCCVLCCVLCVECCALCAVCCALCVVYFFFGYPAREERQSGWEGTHKNKKVEINQANALDGTVGTAVYSS